MTDYIIIFYYVLTLTSIIVMGIVFSKIQYKKGQADAYKKVYGCLDELSNNLEKQLEEQKREGTD